MAGLMGIIAATILFARKYKIAIFTLGDLVAAAGPIGLGLGRLSNFINGELYGRTTDAPIGMIFPRAGDNLPRHPSQLYEAGLEGIALFFIIFILMRFTSISRYPGVIGGIFLSGYGLARFSIEFFREPDAQLGFLFAGATMGQLLSLPMIFSGLCIIIWALKYKAHQK
jgi:phosphatidylglycerol:prolipoprotein diacylglycerol transferase